MGSVSVVIPAYNPRAGWLAEAVESALEQVPAPAEVIVVDDGSDEPVVLPEHWPVHVVRQENTGVAGARNRGLASAKSEFVAFLDQDDVWYPGKLAAQLDRMAPEVGLCSTGSDIIRDGERVPGSAGGPGVLDYGELLHSNRITASSVLVRREALVAAGGFPRGIRLADDWAAWLAIARGHRVEHVPEVLVGYRQHGSNASGDYVTMWVATLKVLAGQRTVRALPGLRATGRIHGAQAFDAFRRDRRPADLGWAIVMWPDYVARQVARQVASRLRR